MLGYAEAEIGNTLAEWEGRLHPEDREGVQTELQRYLAGQTPSYVSEHRLRCRDGSWKWILDRGKVVQRGTDGEPQRIIGTHTDIDVRKQMEEKLRHLTAVLRAVRHVNQLMTQEKDRDRLLRRACAGLIATRGYHYCWIALDDAEGGLRAVAEAGVGADFAAVRVALERGDWPASCRQVMGAAADIAVRHGTASDCATCSLVSFRGDTATLAGRLRHADRDYGVLVVALPAALADDAEEQSLFRELAGDLGYALHLLEMEQDRERLISAMEQTGEAVVITDSVGIIRYVNPAFERITGYPRAEALGRPPGFLKSGEQDADFYRDLWGTIAAGRAWQGRLVNRRRDGDLYTEEMSISPVSDQAGRISAYVAVKRDITGRLLLERQLRQAQKMEAVGRLAGGVAHDYNNMLTVISGYAEMALTRVERDDPLHEDLTEILAAARRSTDITRQLLAFSRQQTIKPRVLDLNETVAGMMKMLRRLIGEDIDLAWRPAADICAVKVDPTQIDQVLANLCVDARDAITGVGKVVIETGRATFDETYCSLHQGFVPGRFALLAVSDDGCGMDEKTRDNLFEPFFTTKERGRGTGLGLATVYGIVKQNDGFINVYSEPD
ncbi:MAG: PAS domain S-box protein, partial [Deltaproteobacteria bacterium]|nr:PAS domain S-box protein [Candidatus Anaeroferrophillacea bacterium]